jgi:hypothetical protein
LELIQAFALPLIVLSEVMLVIAGFSDAQIAPVIGLLGTISGYLLRSRDPKQEPPPPAVPPP